MLALVSGSSSGLVGLQRVPEPPAPDPGCVTVKVKHIAVNRGELHRLRERPPGWRPGWDFAGEVVAAHDDAGPRRGELVAGFLLEGAWAQLVNAPVNQVASVPDTLGSATASCVPVAGVTARRILRLAEEMRGGLRGCQVLVVGAAGGVGQFAIPLALRAGADVHGLTSTPERRGLISRAGATPLLADDLQDHVERFDVILESAGGRVLATCVGVLARRGVIVTYGNSERAETTFPTSAFYEREGRLLGFHLLRDVEGDPPHADLRELFALVAAGDLPVHHGSPLPWTAIDAALDGLSARTLEGKAVVEVEHDA